MFLVLKALSFLIFFSYVLIALKNLRVESNNKAKRVRDVKRPVSNPCKLKRVEFFLCFN